MSNDLLTNLAGEGALAARGEFKLDQGKAREKMEQFQLVDPYYYVMELVQAAHLLGATFIDFKVDSDELEMTFDGNGFTVEELDDIYSAAFSREADDRIQARRHFAIALTAIGALKPAEVYLTMPFGDDNEHAQLIMSAENEEVSATKRPRHKNPLPQDMNRLYVREKFRLGHVVDFFKAIDGNHREVELIRTRCCYASIPIKVNGERISHGHKLSDRTEHIVTVTWGDERGLLGLDRSDSISETKPGEVKLLQNGVWITSVSLDTQMLPVEAVFETSRLTKNLSQSAFVKNDAFRTLVRTVLEEATHESMLAWVENLAVSSSNYNLLRSVCVGIWQQVTKRKPGSTSAAVRLARALESLPVWPTASEVDGPEVFGFGASQMISLRAFNSAKPELPLLFADRRFHGVKSERPVFLLRADTKHAFYVIKNYTGRDGQSATPVLQALETRERNRQRWSMRTWHPSNIQNPHVVRFHSNGFAVSLFTAIDRATKIRLVHVHEGKVLNSGAIPESLPAAQIVIEGTFRPNDLFDAPMRTPELEATYRDVILRLPEVWMEVANDPDSAKSTVAMKQTAIAALQLITGTYSNFAFRAFGFSDSSRLSVDLQADDAAPDTIRIGGRSGQGVEAIDDRLAVLGSLLKVKNIQSHLGLVSLAPALKHARDSDPPTLWTGDLEQLARVRTHLSDWDRGPIVSNEYPWGLLAKSAFGRTTDAIEFLLNHAAEKTYMAQPKTNHWELTKHPQYVVCGAVSGDGWNARWGARSTSLGSTRVRALWNERCLETRELDRKLGTIDVVVRGNAIKPSSNYQSMESDDFLRFLIESVDLSFQLELNQLCNRAHDPDSEGLSPAESEFLWRIMSDAFQSGDSLSSKLFARDTQGRPYNARHLGGMAMEDAIYWVQDGLEVLDDLVPAGKPVVEIPSQEVLQHLYTIAGTPEKTVEVSATEAASRLINEARTRFYRREPRVMKVPYAVMSRTFSDHPITVVVGLLAYGRNQPVESGLIICRENRVVARHDITLPFGRFEIVYNNDELPLDPRWEKPLEGLARAAQEADEACEKVAIQYIHQISSSATASMRNRAIQWLLAGLKNETQTRNRWPQAWEHLCQLPLFAKPGLGFESLNGFREIASKGVIVYLESGDPRGNLDGVHVIADGQTRQLLQEVFGDKIVRAADQLNTPIDPPSAQVDVAVSGESVSPDVDDVDTPDTAKPAPVWEIDSDLNVATIAEFEPEFSPDILLLNAVRDHIDQASRSGDRALAAKYTEQLQMWGNDPQRAARVTSDKVWVMTDHILTTYALENIHDPIRQAFLASAVLTVINHHYEEVDENDESSLQQALLVDLARGS